MLVFTDERMADHDPGEHHPDRPARLQAALDGFDGFEVEWRTPEPAPVEALLRVHDAAHIDLVERSRGQRGMFDADTTVSEGSVPAAYLAAGAALEATRAVMNSKRDVAWAVVRPPGHHAEPMVPMGFCLFNNVAVAAAEAAAAGHRVAVVDFDVHHGNGTQHAFDGRDDVLFFSLHQYPFYPGTGAPNEIGEGIGKGHTINFGMPPGCNDGDYLAAFDEVLLPAMHRFEPELIVVSAGYDGHREDALGGMNLTEAGFAAMTARLEAVGRPLVMSLEGGYAMSALTRSVAACTDALVGGAKTIDVDAATSPGARAVADTRRVHAARWGL